MMKVEYRKIGAWSLTNEEAMVELNTIIEEYIEKDIKVRVINIEKVEAYNDTSKFYYGCYLEITYNPKRKYI